MEWRIRECSKGGFVTEYGKYHAGGVQIDNIPGVTMPMFMVYRSAWHKTKKEAEQFIEQIKKKRSTI